MLATGIPSHDAFSRVFRLLEPQQFEAAFRNRGGAVMDTPFGMVISAGEYGYDMPDFHRMLEAQAVDVLQADTTRCCGITGFPGIPLSSHCASPECAIAHCC